ncbi:N-terminal nucleophile aminohydrolase [Gonapodya prolifera JEL478]|uniref:Proteasome subunit beta n=1 Tax=Gonapodya prolifera (strain JEL478) TaxID=1344416 RepID=A0A139AEJ5_GONPJ|nr:N-terminal nucleophile aminohydrolase [Gonapodya prolifera JEL478]|eukprot:KXS15014.1 N-terminal nucleophile aminohydrolase [Gonapodya prolifera JEL478]
MAPIAFGSDYPVHGYVTEHAFSPYTDNGGTTVAIAGEDFCVVAADTRQSEGYSINSRYSPKAFKLTDKAVLATSGFFADGATLVKRLGQRIEWYAHRHEKVMPTSAIAQMLSITLYGKRFFPYYVFNILGGVDEEGKGAVYSFDPVGSFEREACRAGGSAASLIQPFLDNQINFRNIAGATPRPLPLEEVLKLVKDAFTSAAERDIYTGDMVEIWIIRKDGVERTQYPLKLD